MAKAGQYGSEVEVIAMANGISIRYIEIHDLVRK